jgi:hypothetical protein
MFTVIWVGKKITGLGFGFEEAGLQADGWVQAADVKGGGSEQDDASLEGGRGA